MTRMTWSKFFWDDVLRDHNLQRCTFTARGFWLHLKALSVQAEPMGYLAEGDKPMTSADIARLSHLDKRSVERLLGELEAAGVFSRDAHGVIYCRRIVRENAARLRNKINGSAGGNPQLAAKNGETSDNPYKLKAKQLEATQLAPPDGAACAAPDASRSAPLIRAAEVMGTTLDALHRKYAWSVFGDTLRRVPTQTVPALRSHWPQAVQDVADAYGYTPPTVRLSPASPQAIDRMMQTFTWFKALEDAPHLTRAVWLTAAAGMGPRRAAHILGIHRDTVRARRDEALDRIADALREQAR